MGIAKWSLASWGSCSTNLKSSLNRGSLKWLNHWKTWVISSLISNGTSPVGCLWYLGYSHQTFARSQKRVRRLHFLFQRSLFVMIILSGASIRLDTTLVDFTEMRWERGDITFLYKGRLRGVGSCNQSWSFRDFQERPQRQRNPCFS